MVDYNSDDIWGFYVDGLPGVKRRFCEEVARYLQKNDIGVDYGLGKIIGVPEEIITKIRNSEDVSEYFSSHVVERLANSCRVDLCECFRLRDMSKTEEDDVVAAADQRGFVRISGAGDKEWPRDDRIAFFLMLSGLRRLDVPEETMTRE